MSDVTVVVENTTTAVTVTNLTDGSTAQVEVANDPVTVVIAEVGVQGPPGPGSELDPNFVIDGGNF
jgi:hypothetical protein